ncbi:MAG: 2-dehydro-3-deoxyphosphooctonate aldolase [Candidatus Binatia bacterium]|nr:MAG: 2-dehydro-3-deoxyphosphooctonate aldolase [Candidatus Binatia bacterium]
MSCVIEIRALRIGGGAPFVFIGGPCVIESRDSTLRHAEALHTIGERARVPVIFKSSFDKANRTSLHSFRGPGLHEGVEILAQVRRDIGIPVLTDVHEIGQARLAAEVVDILQTPAFLVRQTDFLVDVARAGKPVNVKKGQFLAPWDMGPVVEKIRATGNHQILVTERGTTFGYNNLVVDFRSLTILRDLDVAVVFDAGHSVQLPGGRGDSSGGQRQFIRPLARAAVAIGIDALFLEVHEDPDHALSDGPNSYPLKNLEGLLIELREIDAQTKGL